MNEWMYVSALDKVSLAKGTNLNRTSNTHMLYSTIYVHISVGHGLAQVCLLQELYNFHLATCIMIITSHSCKDLKYMLYNFSKSLVLKE